MTLFWLAAAALTAGVVLLLVPPLLRPRAAAGERQGYDRAVYRDQLAELDRDLARGLIDAEQAEAARAEIGRRVLAAARDAAPEGTAPDRAPDRAPASARVLAAVLAVGIPLGALAVYLPLGRPDLPAQPLAARAPVADPAQPPPDVVAAVEKLKAHLDRTPGDLRGWIVLGQTYARMGIWEGAADAFGHAAALDPANIDLAAAHGESLVNASGGVVPEQARIVFDGVLAKQPKEPRARFYLAQARFQAGDAAGALDGWRGLAAETPPDAPWLPVLRERIAAAAGALGLDAATVTPPPLPAAPSPSATAGAPADAGAQNEMIRGMVDGLAARLDANPDDVDGWIRLARSYRVLGQPDRAEAAARQAATRAPQRADARMALAEALLPPDAGDGARPLPPAAVDALRAVLGIDPANQSALWLLGLEAARDGRAAEAAELWGRLLTQLDPAGSDHATVRQRIDGLRRGG